MRGIILSVLIAVSSCAKLDNTYLPPSNARDAGGNEDSLELPLEPPYIDPYSGNEPKYSYGAPTQRGRPKSSSQGRYEPQPNQYGRNLDFNKVNNIQQRGRDESIEDEDEIRNVQDSSFPRRSKSRFLSGSYSYTGPNNVLVTVTYTADRSKQGRKLGRNDDDDEQQRRPQGRKLGRNDDDDEQQQRRSQGRKLGRNDDDDEQQRRSLDDAIIPTPPSLPAELQKAFEFHKKKQQQPKGRNAQDQEKGYHYDKPGKSRSDKGDRNEGEGYSYPKPEQ